jgi:hypothetical protein
MRKFNKENYGEDFYGVITHCEVRVDWIDCPRHNETSCKGTVCAICRVTDFDCEGE